MPAIATQFIASAASAATIPVEIQSLRTAVTPAYRNVLRPTRIDALYELAYLRAFASWEAFLEDAVLHMMCGFVSPIYAPIFPPGMRRSLTLTNARATLFGARDYLLWHNPSRIEKQAGKVLAASPIELVVKSNAARLEAFAAIRHRIAHQSDDAETKFDKASMTLIGRRLPGSRAGRLLSTNDPAYPGLTFLQSIVQELGALSLQIAP